MLRDSEVSGAMLGEGGVSSSAVKRWSWVDMALEFTYTEKMKRSPRDLKLAILLEMLVASFCRLRWDLLQAI